MWRPESLMNVPYGLDGTNYRWVDLDGEGLSGNPDRAGGELVLQGEPEPGQRAAHLRQLLHAAAVRAGGTGGTPTLDRGAQPGPTAAIQRVR